MGFVCWNDHPQAREIDAAAIAKSPMRSSVSRMITFTTDERSVNANHRGYHGARQRVFGRRTSMDMLLGLPPMPRFARVPDTRRRREHSIQLSPDARGQGVGRALMRALEEVGPRTDGVHVLVAGISSANPGAIAVSRSVGFFASWPNARSRFQMGSTAGSCADAENSFTGVICRT